jgi:hypothetical protein
MPTKKNPPNHMGFDKSSATSTGTLTGTLTELISGKEYPLTAYGFSRSVDNGRWISIWGEDPEWPGQRQEYWIHVKMNVVEPPSGTYQVGDAKWGGVEYWRVSTEMGYGAESGQLVLRNFESVRHLEGELEIVTAQVKDIKYKLNIEFTVVG